MIYVINILDDYECFASMLRFIILMMRLGAGYLTNIDAIRFED